MTSPAGPVYSFSEVLQLSATSDAGLSTLDRPRFDGHGVGLGRLSSLSQETQGASAYRRVFRADDARAAGPLARALANLVALLSLVLGA